MRDIPLAMVRSDMDGWPVCAFPDGYFVRSFEPGDQAVWARIEAAVDGFSTEAAASAHFQQEFGEELDRLPGRLLFLEHDGAGPIGMTTAWDGTFAGVRQGRIHWVAIVPDHQGRGLAKPLLSAAMQRIAADFDRAYLTTETTSWRGINLYLGFGFEPVIDTALDREGWAIVEEILGRRIV